MNILFTRCRYLSIGWFPAFGDTQRGVCETDDIFWTGDFPEPTIPMFAGRQGMDKDVLLLDQGWEGKQDVKGAKNRFTPDLIQKCS